MSVRSRATTPAVMASAGPGTALAVADPAAMRAAAEGPSQMGMTHPFAPGEPVGPYDGYSRHTRAFDFTTGYNIATRPRTHERVSFDTLRGLIEAYDVAQIAIWHRIDSIRSLDWKLTAADGFSGDITDAVRAGMAALRKPDREHGFGEWLAKWLYDVLAYDAGCLYRLRNRAGRCVGLMPTDGTSVAPLLDYWGGSPQPPAEAYVQYVNGLPWNWLTRSDLIYEPFRPRTNSPYGHAPLESIILNANTDVRFQVYFLERFTKGNIPEAFASAPETWSPDQIEKFQVYWDSFMYGDQSRKHEIRWIPGGSSFTWSNEKEFTDQFSLFLMRKSLAAYHVVPTDVGFTDSANYSTGESQADVGHRVGDLPFGHYAERIITSFLQDDLGLPLQHQFDWGEEQDDRLNQAQADAVYVEHAVVSASELREMRFGLSEPEGQVVPRVFFTARSGPIPLAALYGVSGKIDPETAAPDPGVPLPHEAFTEVQGAIPNPPLISEPLAEQEFGPKAVPPAPPPQPQGVPVATDPSHQVAKEDGGATAGITSETGITSYDLTGQDDDEDEDDRTAAVKAELTAFHRFRRARRKAGTWRDFEFRAAGKVQAHRLNDAGRAEVRKAAGEVAVAGLAVQAADTGRVLMLQRALCDGDPAGGTWEFPGGHLDNGETPLQGAWREWAEETGAMTPPGRQTGTWASADGIYQGIVWTTDSESSVPVRCDTQITNPDDPDGDQVESIAWWSPDQLPDCPAIRPELLASIDTVMAALACCGSPCCLDGGCCQGAGGCTCGPSGVAKAGQSPKASWPGWKLDGPAVAYWAPKVTAAVTAALPEARLNQIAAEYLTANPEPPQDGQKQQANEAASAWLATLGVTFPLADLAAGIAADGYLIGAVSAAALVTGTKADTGDWKPGDTQAAQEITSVILGAGPGPDAQSALAMASAYQAAMGRSLADSQQQKRDRHDAAAVLVLVLADKDLAAGVTGDLITAASGQAAQDVYTARQVKYGRWVTDPSSKSGPCPVCLANEAAGSVPTGNPYPSGDVRPPVHPNCNCQVVPA